ncbi:DUF2993 domain-containing protein [Corynebacterium sp. UBA2622]|uniref:LmeA family phospholipid-binding protein n=1 Tax=Corynebacterium sp. UBA2622 TaxID=1946393 RepID=UPI0025C49A6A|nr:DUF2993 domain-containing protein [Corynebacterium sp. UBA2622]
MSSIGRLVRRVWRWAAVFAIVLVVALAADTIVGSRAENRLSNAAESFDGLAYPPDTYIGGFPFTQALFTDSVPRLSLTTLDAPVEGLGIVNATAEAFDIDVPGRQVLNADFTGAEASLVRRRIRLDGVAFGQLLNMTDLDISNPYDISPTGGVASEARLTGTVPGMEVPSTVVVTLRLEDGVLEMRPSALVDAPRTATGDDAARILDAFTLKRDTRDLPLGGPADLVQVSGGSIEFSRDRINVTLTPDDLTPLAPTTR